MKFGKTIQRLCVDEWRKWYVDYKSLKKCIKRLQNQLEQQEEWEEEEEMPHDVNQATSSNAKAAKRQVAENGQKMFLAALSKEAAKVNRLYLDEVTLWESQYEEMISVLRTYQTSTFTPLMTHSSHKKAKQRARRLRKIKLKKKQQKKPFMGMGMGMGGGVGTKQQQEQTSTSDDSDSPPEMSPSIDPMQAAFGGSISSISTSTDLESDTEIPEHLVRQFTSWCMQLDKMRSFCLLNHVAFIKIVKKYDKKVNRLIAASLRANPAATASVSASTSSSSSMDWDATSPIPSIRDECMSTIMLQPFYCSLRLANLITRAECVASLLTEQPSSADFQCPVCLDVLSNPVVLSCAHRFCWDCLARASATQSKCPVCRKQQSLDPNVYQVNDCLDSFLACHFPNEYKPRKTSLPLCPPSNLTSPLLLLNTPAAQAAASASSSSSSAAATSSSSSSSSSSAPSRVTRSNSKRYRTVPTTRSPLPGSLASLFSSISAQTQSVVDKEFASLFEGDSPTTATAMDRTSDADQLSSSLPPISRSLPWSVHSTRTAQLLQARYSTAPVSMTPPVTKHSHGAISSGSSLPISPKIRPYDSELDCDTFDDLSSSDFFLGPGSAPITIPAPELTKSKQQQQQRSILTPDGNSSSEPPSPSTLTSRLSPSAREFVPSSRATGKKSKATSAAGAAGAGEALSKTPELGQSMTQLTLRDDDAVMDDVETTPPPTLPTPTAGKSLLSDAVASVRASRQSDADTSSAAAAAAVATAAAAAAAATSPTSAARAALVTTGAHALPDNNPVMGLEFGTTPDARPAMYDPIPVMTLNSISGLLQHATSGTYIALDIDETIHINKYQPCMMMSEKGIQAFQIILSASPAYKHLHFSAKNHLTKKMQTALHQKRFVEQNTGTVIQELQARGCHVFGLTARYSDMAAATVRELHSLGIDFTLTSPFPKGKMMRDPSTEAVCQDGIIFTNANEKGPIFDRFLSSILIHGGADGQTFIPVPQHIVFADDREQNAQSVLTGLSVAEKLNIRITSYHYVPPATCHDAGDDGDDAGHDVDAILAAAAAVTAEYAAGSPTMSSMQLDSGAIEIDILQFQIHHFLNTTHILSDHQARRLWTAHKTSSSSSAAAPKQLQQSQSMEIKGNKNKKSSGLTPTVNYNKRPATTATTVAGAKKQQTGASHNPMQAAHTAQASASTNTTTATSSTSTSHSMSRPIPIPTRAR